MKKITTALLALFLFGSAAYATDSVSSVCLKKLITGIESTVFLRKIKLGNNRPETISNAIESASEKTGVSQGLILSIIINESNMSPEVYRSVKGRNGQTAIDVGLGGIRCYPGLNGKCTNGLTRGLTVEQLKDPVTNVMIVAKMLARMRDAPVYVRGKPCNHTGHAYWAHYNWGSNVFTTGWPKGYPERVATIGHEIERITGQKIPELEGVPLISMKSRHEARYRVFKDRIRTCFDCRCTTVACKD